VGPSAVLDAVMKRKIPIPRRESNPRTPIHKESKLRGGLVKQKLVLLRACHGPSYKLPTAAIAFPAEGVTQFSVIKWSIS
jgi:hypothetical protein